MTLNAKIGGFVDFLAISGCDTSLYHSQGGATIIMCTSAWLYQKVFYFIPNSRKSNSNSDRFSLYNFVVLWAQ